MKIRILVLVLAILGTQIAPAPASAETLLGPGPDDLTWAEVAALPAANSVFISNGKTRAAAGVCSMDSGNIYKRTSGSGTLYGTVGMKPTTNCSVAMLHIVNTVHMYKTTWFGWQGQGTWSNENSGYSSLTLKTVEVICNDLRSTEFYGIFESTGTFPGGSTAKGTVYQTATLACGTF